MAAAGDDHFLSNLIFDFTRFLNIERKNKVPPMFDAPLHNLVKDYELTHVLITLLAPIQLYRGYKPAQIYAGAKPG